MNIKTVFGLIAAGLTIGVAGWYAAQGRVTTIASAPLRVKGNPLVSNAAQVPAMANQLADMQKKIDSLVRELSDTKARQAALANTTKTDHAQANEAAKPSPEVQAQLVEERRVQQLQTLENRLALEGRDKEWSAASETTIRAGLAQAAGQLTIGEVKCATSLCRFTGTMAEHGNPGELYQAVVDKVQWPGETQLTMDPNTGQVVAYLGRPGTAMVDQGTSDQGF